MSGKWPRKTQIYSFNFIVHSLERARPLAVMAPRVFGRLFEGLVSFCGLTGIHGCSYIFDGARNKIESVFWAIIGG